MNYQITKIESHSLTRLESLQSLPEEVAWLADFNSRQSKETYGDAISQFRQFIGIEKPEDFRLVEGKHITAFKSFLLEQGKSHRTVNNRLSALSSLFNHLVDQQLMRYNPVKGIRRLRVNNNRVESKCLTPSEGRLMLDAPLQYNQVIETWTKDDLTARELKNRPHPLSELQILRDRSLLHVLLFSGCRISEVCKLKVGDYFEEQGHMILDFSLKGGERNKVAIHKELEIMLNQYLDESGHRNDLKMPLFLPVKGKRENPYKHLTRQNLDLLWNKYANFIGLQGTSPHSARTTFATVGLTNGCELKAMQRTLGHKQSRTTEMYDQREVKLRESASYTVRY